MLVSVIFTENRKEQNRIDYKKGGHTSIHALWPYLLFFAALKFIQLAAHTLNKNHLWMDWWLISITPLLFHTQNLMMKLYDSNQEFYANEDSTYFRV